MESKIFSKTREFFVGVNDVLNVSKVSEKLKSLDLKSKLSLTNLTKIKDTIKSTKVGGVAFVALSKVFCTKLSKETKKRIFSGAAFGVFCFVIIVRGRSLYNLFIMFVGCIMCAELVSMLSKKEDNKVYRSYKKWGLLLILSSMGSLLVIRHCQQGFELVSWLFMTTFANDITAYFVGKNFGKKKIAPVVSPSKTVEGSAAGLVASIFVSALLFEIFRNSLNDGFTFMGFMLFSLIVAVLSQLGDLTESYIKRKCEVKDSGFILPGHGGMLDRFDSFLFTPILVYIMSLIYRGIIF